MKLGGGGGGSAPTVISPLTIISSKPAYIPEPPAIAPGYARFFLTWGTVNGRVATNWSEPYDVSLATNTTVYLFMKATFAITSANASELEVAEVEWVTGTSYGSHQTPPWGEDGTRPAYAIIQIGQIIVSDSSAYAFNIAGGSILLSDYVHDISSDATGGIVFKKRLAHVRLTY